MCGSPDAPPPPPDYSRQLANFRATEQNSYNTQADQYNAAANAFNNNISQFGTQIGEGLSNFGNLSISDPDRLTEAQGYWNNLYTQAQSPWEFSYGGPTATGSASLGGSGSFGGFDPTGIGDLDGFGVGGNLTYGTATGGGTNTGTNTNTGGTGGNSYSFNGLTGFSLAAPNFQSVITSPYAGNTVQLNTPSLVNPNTQQGQDYLRQIQQQISTIDNLFGQRETELDRIQGFQSQYNSGLSNLENMLGGLNYADSTGISNVQSQLGMLEQQRTGFSSALRDEFGDFFGATPNAEDYMDITGGISRLQQERTAEEERINAFRNERLGLFNSSFDQLRDMGIADYDQFRSLDRTIDDTAREMRQFQSLLNPDFSRELGAYQDADALAAQLTSQYNTENNRNSNYENQLRSQANALAQQAQLLGITDEGGMNALMQQIQALQSQAGDYQSELGFDFSQELDPLSGAMDAIGGLRTQRTEEQGRISQYEGQLRQRMEELTSRLGELSIADYEEIQEIDQQLSALDRESRGFEAELPFNFSNLYSQFGDLDSQIAGLYNDRNAELGRVNSFQSNAERQAQQLLRSLTAGNFRDGNMLNAYGFDIENIMEDIGGFESVLGADFTGANDQLSEAQQMLADLQSRREEALTGFSGQATSALDDVNSLDLWNTGGMNTERSQANQLLNQLSSFTGEDAQSIRDMFGDVFSRIDERGSELNTARGDLEYRAQSLRDSLDGQAFYGDDDLGMSFEDFRSLQDEINRYGATQASDEVGDISRFFTDERGRLASDRDAVAERERADRLAGEEQIASNNLEGFFQNLRTNPMNDIDYAELMQLLGGGGQSSFSRNLGF